MYQVQLKQYLVINQSVEKPKALFILIFLFRFKKTELCLQTIFDIACPDDTEILKQQLINEQKTSLPNNEDLSNDSKCKIFLFYFNRKYTLNFSCSFNNNKRELFRNR